MGRKLSKNEAIVRLAELRGLRAICETLAKKAPPKREDHQAMYARVFEMLDELEAQPEDEQYDRDLVNSLLSELHIMYTNAGGDPENLK